MICSLKLPELSIICSGVSQDLPCVSFLVPVFLSWSAVPAVSHQIVHPHGIQRSPPSRLPFVVDQEISLDFAVVVVSLSFHILSEHFQRYGQTNVPGALTAVASTLVPSLTHASAFTACLAQPSVPPLADFHRLLISYTRCFPR